MRRKPWEGLRQTDQRSAQRAADWNVRRQIAHGLSPLDPTLSSKTYIVIGSGAQAVGRVALRVKLGGHHVPENDVLRRFDRSRRHFIADCLPLADEWWLWDNQSVSVNE